MSLKHSITIIGNSGGSDAKDASSNGDRFSIYYDDPIKVPPSAYNVELKCLEASVYNVVPNISAALGNNQFKITGPNTADVSTVYTLTIPDGLYDYQSLEADIQRQLENAGAKIVSGSLVEFSPNIATSKLKYTLSYASTTIDFTIANSCYEILGATQTTYTGTAGLEYEFENAAVFNNIAFFLLHTNLCSRGLRENSSYNQAVMKIPITEGVGSQIVYEPRHLSIVGANSLIGRSISRSQFWLTDEANIAVSMSESWSFRVLLTWETPLPG